MYFFDKIDFLFYIIKLNKVYCFYFYLRYDLLIFLIFLIYYYLYLILIFLSITYKQYKISYFYYPEQHFAFPCFDRECVGGRIIPMTT